VTKLTREPIVQGDLFDDHRHERHERHEALDGTIDTIRAQFGTGSIQRGSLLDKSVRKPDEEA
jgi:anti-sigma factor ChrR (cupin superfamily)